MRRILLLLAVFTFCAMASASPLVVAYVFPRGAALQPSDFNPRAIDRINYAFAVIHDGRMAAGSALDAGNFGVLTGLRQQNPTLKVLVSVGGWLGSGGFSEMAASRKNRALFIESVLQFLKVHQLDGLDVDWEYPGMPGSGHAYRADDKQNFTALLKELRERFDAESKHGGRNLLLSIAAGASDDYLQHTELGSLQSYVDTVNVMTYDYYEPGSEPISGNHAPLFTDPADPLGVSADKTLRAFEAAGVPAEKLVMGIPFYGHAWSNVPATQHGLFQSAKPAAQTSIPFTAIPGLLVQGYTRFWDEAAHVPYLYDAATHTFVSYEDQESVREKCRYVLDHKLGGVMFWDYFSDNGQLLNTIDVTLDHPTGAAAKLPERLTAPGGRL